MKTIEIDGSQGEGGGQILRTALSLSCITGQGLRLFNIRKGRKRPGLMPQHLACVNAAARISAAAVEGNKTGSTALTFVPNKIRAGDHSIDIGTAGSCSLVLQTVLLPLVHADRASTVLIKGGTHVPFSPSYHYISGVFIPMLERLGIRVEPRIMRYGFYPKGGGEVSFRILPTQQIRGVNLIGRKVLKALTGCSVVSRLPKSIAERQKDSMLRKLLSPADIELVEADSFSPGTFVFLKAEYENGLAGFSSLGERGRPAEDVGRDAARQFEEFHNTSACIDPHLADQIVPYLCLAKEDSAFATARITQHLMTNLWVTGKFLDVRYEIDGELNEEGRVRLIFGK